MSDALLYFNDLLPVVVLLPLVALLIAACLSRLQEKIIAYLAIGTTAAALLGNIALTLLWQATGHDLMSEKLATLYRTSGFEFALTFQYDRISAVFGITGAVLTLLVAWFSRFYMHRDPGFKRFFCTLLLFFAGYQFVVLSGNFETLFIGWEFIGMTSFLLIAHYRERYLPVRNGYKVLSFYRLGDMFLMLAMWFCHHYFHQNIAFKDLSIISSAGGEPSLLAGAAICIAVAAVIKSAQFPFMTWLPRALEGPTTSSAIFYGALASHIGVFLLLRTAPLWAEMDWLRFALMAIGGLTAVTAHYTSTTQGTIKTKIAYASIAQIGLMVIAVALGWYWLALAHFVGNACLRAYQLLVSPSVLSYQGHDMVFHPNLRPISTPDQIKAAAWTNSLYVASMKEWNLDGFLRACLWQPLKIVGTWLGFLVSGNGLVFNALCAIVLAGLPLVAAQITTDYGSIIALLAGCIAVGILLAAFAYRGAATQTWLAVCAAQLLMFLAYAWLPKSAPLADHLLYISSPLLAAVVGYLALRSVEEKGGRLSLGTYYGHVFEHPITALVFLVSCLVLSGFPLLPNFIGVDVQFARIGHHDYALLVAASLFFVLIELVLIRIYCRAFLGQHVKENHAIALKSS
jgi:NADH-quinone oxidoreductase subunit L